MQEAIERKESNTSPANDYFFTIKAAGLLIGSGKSATHTLAASTGRNPLLDPFDVAKIIFDSAIVPRDPSEWYLLYPDVETNLKDFLQEVETFSQAPELAKRSILILEKMILQHAMFDAPVSIGAYHAVRIEITEPIQDIYVDADKAQRLYCILKLEGKELGRIELPICDGLISEWVLKDAVAVQFAWQIFGRFFENTIYNKIQSLNDEVNKSFEDIYSKIGWLTFYRQLWNRPDWEMDKFYDVENEEDIASYRLNEADKTVIEISRDLPVIDVTTEDFFAVYSIGGVEAGVIKIAVKNNLVTPSQIRTAINIDAGFELCRICVREALIGRSLTDAATLAERLGAAALLRSDGEKSFGINNCCYTIKNTVSSQSLILGRRADAINTSALRRAIFPKATASQLIEMAKVANEPVIAQPVNTNETDRVLYVPEIITAQPVILQGSKLENKKQNVSVFGRQHFETLFSKKQDPWKYTSPYEQTKYEFTLSLLPKKTIKKALEIACAEGHFTEQLAPIVKSLVAVDISLIALERAAERCKQFDHIKYGQLDLVKDELPGKFDLICCSEVLYFVGGLEKLITIAKKFSEALLPNGYLVMAHAHQVIDEPDKPGFDWGLAFGAKVIGDVFSGVPKLRLIKEIHTPLYRVQLFQKTRSKIFSWFLRNKPSIKYLEQPTPIPASAKDSVRWNGGQQADTEGILNASTNKLPILMYHRVAPEGEANMRRFRITPDTFEEQLKYLKESGYYSAGINDWLTAMALQRPLPGLAIVFTFDDAYQDFYDYAWPLLKKYDFTAIVFLVSDYVGKHITWDEGYEEKLPLMGWKEILELEQQGVEFGSHSATHKPLTSLSPAEVVVEGARSRTALQKYLQKPVKLFAYPYGDADAVITHLIGGCGYTLGFSCNNKLSSFTDDPMRLPRIEVEGSFGLKDFIAKLS